MILSAPSMVPASASSPALESSRDAGPAAGTQVLERIPGERPPTPEDVRDERLRGHPRGAGLGVLGNAAAYVKNKSERASAAAISLCSRAGSGESPRTRRRVTWKSALGAGLVCFAVWLLFDSPVLFQSAKAAPLGARRTVAIDLLRPIDDVSTALGLSHLVGAADRVIGRTGNGVVKVVGPPVHSRGATPTAKGTPPEVRSTRSVAGESGSDRSLAPDGLSPLAPPSAADPLRVLSVGDSLGVDFGQTFVNDLAATGVVNAVLDARVDTGLSRPDYFDWPAELQADVSKYHPQAVVVFLGANDPQNFVDGGTALAFGTPGWETAYARRVGDFIGAATSSGARVLWIGMPPMADPTLNAKMQLLNSIYEREAELYPGASYIGSWPVLSDPGGGFAAFLPNSSGDEVEVREPDGTHIAPGGAERISQSAIAAMDHLWELQLQP